MKINHYFSVLVFLVILASLSFADSAPPPPSLVTVHLVSNGVNETSIGEIVYHCTPLMYTDSYADEGYNISLACNAGTCTNTPHYTPTECIYFPAGYFTYSYQGQNKTSESFNATIKWQNYYEYQLDVQTGKITLISSSGKNDPGVFCGPAFIGFTLLSLFCLKLESKKRFKK